MIEHLTVEHRGYRYSIQRRGDLWVARCNRTGRAKTRNTKGEWTNADGSAVGDETLCEALDSRIHDYLRSQSHGPRPPFVAHDGHYSTPPMRSKGLVTPREKRANGRAE